jgi:very-short-patch-repair endonuclease
VDAQAAKADPDREIAWIAAHQHGVITIRQLDDVGIHRQGRARRVRQGRLHRIHRGVYAVGHAGLSEKGRWIAAVLACGPAAVLSHISAGALWEMFPVRKPSGAWRRQRAGAIHVTVPGKDGRTHRDTIRVHHSVTLRPSQVTLRDRIPVTTPSRTLSDLRRVLPVRQFSAALREAEFLGLPLDTRLKPDGTRSEMEAAFLRLCRRHRLPRPVVNIRIAGFDVDFLWLERRLAVEVDGWDSHRTRSAFEADRARDTKLKLLGYEVVRFTWRQLTSDPATVAVALRELLQRPRPAG